MAVNLGVMVTDLVTVTGDPSCTLEADDKEVPLELVTDMLDKVTGSGRPVTETMGFMLIKLCDVSMGERSLSLSSERCS